MTTSRNIISNSSNNPNQSHTPIKPKASRKRSIPESVCSKEELTAMEEIHRGLWEQGWKLKTISKRKYGWQFYIISRSNYELLSSKKALARDICKEFKAHAAKQS